MITEERYGKVLRALAQYSWSRSVKNIRRECPGMSEADVFSRIEDLIALGLVDGESGPLRASSYILLNKAGRDVLAQLPAPAKATA